MLKLFSGEDGRTHHASRSSTSRPYRPPTSLMQDIYSQAFVRDLFNEMSATYGTVNVLSSFGFCVRWRRRCIQQLTIHPTDTVLDLMSGMGELWPSIAPHLTEQGRISALDFSPQMCKQSKHTAQRLTPLQIEVIEEDMLNNSIADNSADVIVSSFGLKTFNEAQKRALAEEVARILRPNGRFSFVEISVPQLRVLRWSLLFYLHHIVPLLGRLFLGNPDNYRMLGVYTERFQNGQSFMEYCADVGLNVEVKCLFFGCATAVVGVNPAQEIEEFTQ